MVRNTRKTRKSHSKKDEGIMSIPELRHSFEHIEEYVTAMLIKGESRSDLVKGLRKEWRGVFHKELSKKEAEDYIDHLASVKRHTKRKTLRRSGGASGPAAPIAGAPIDYSTRAGMYPAPGEGYGIYTKYVNHGFWNPEPAYKLDLAIGNAQYPTNVPKGMGENTVHFKGGKRRTVRKGGSLLNTVQQLFSRPIPSSSPPSILFDAQTAINGSKLGPSPDQVQRQPDYMLGKLMPQAVKINML
jgi:hypothetical protein